MSDVLVLVDHHDGQVHPVTGQLLTAARRIGTPVAVFFGSDVDTVRPQLARVGAERVYVVDAPEVATGFVAPLSEALAQIARDTDPAAILLANSTSRKEIAARLSIKLSAGLVTDAVDIRPGEDGPVITKPALSGEWTVDAVVTHGIPIVTLKAGAVRAEPVEGAAEPVHVTITFSARATAARIVDRTPRPEDERPSLTEARIVVAGGRGTHGNFAVVEDFADAVGAAVGASRAAVDAGWYPHSAQIGQTGKQVSPMVYIAAGISGAVQHRAGMRTAGVVIAINSDDQAPILDFADLGIVGDLSTVLPQASAAIRAARE